MANTYFGANVFPQYSGDIDANTDVSDVVTFLPVDDSFISTSNSGSMTVSRFASNVVMQTPSVHGYRNVQVQQNGNTQLEFPTSLSVDDVSTSNTGSMTVSRFASNVVMQTPSVHGYRNFQLRTNGNTQIDVVTNFNSSNTINFSTNAVLSIEEAYSNSAMIELLVQGFGRGVIPINPALDNPSVNVAVYTIETRSPEGGAIPEQILLEL